MSQSDLQNIEGQQFTDVRALGGGKVIEGLEFSRTRFLRCALAQFDGPPAHLVVRGVSGRSCKADRSSVQGVYFDEVLVDSLATSPMLHLYGCAFRHVVLRGRIGPLMVVPPNTSLPETKQSVVATGIAEIYQNIDWALDISEASFVDVDFYYVPGHLIRRDPATQFLLHRETFRDVDINALPRYAKIAAGRFEATPFDSIVAVAPKQSPDFDRHLADLEHLRAEGLAE